MFNYIYTIILSTSFVFSAMGGGGMITRREIIGGICGIITTQSAPAICIGLRSSMMAGKVTPPLPYDAEVEYLESTGTQWIDTGLPISQGYRFVANVAFVGEATTIASTGNFLWYAQFGFNLFQCSVDVVTPIAERQMPTIDTSGDVFYETDQRLFVGDKSAAIDGVVYATSTSSVMVSVQNWNYLLFAGVNWASGGRILKYGYAKCRNFAMYDSNNRALIDLVSVRFTNEQGVSEGAMCDRVSGQLFRNAGTGAFVIGPDK